MSSTLSDVDVGKTVENANGERIEIVAAVEVGTAFVEPAPGISDSIEAAIGWEGGSESTVPVSNDAARRITGDAVRLEAEYPETCEPPKAGGGADGDRFGG